jgi:DNA-binding transcriptional LysR family regulator
MYARCNHGQVHNYRAEHSVSYRLRLLQKGISMYSITFQQIEAFLIVSKYLNLSKAAEVMFTSQPALSKTLQRFEEGVGLNLFTRSNRGVTLTLEGEYLYSTLEPIFNHFNRAIGTAKCISTEPPKTVRIVEASSYDATDAFDMLKNFVRSFEDKHPDVLFIESLCDFKELREALVFGDADIVFTQLFALGDISNISYKRICEFELCVAMAADHPMAAYDTLQTDMLSKEVLYRVPIYGEKKDREITFARCRSVGFVPKAVEFVPNFFTLLHMIRGKKGLSICGRFNYICSDDELKYFPVDFGYLEDYVVVAWRTGRITGESYRFVESLPGETFQV